MKDLARSVAAKTRSWVGYPKLTCSFCGRDETEVARLVAGGSAYICDSCIALCVAASLVSAHGWLLVALPVAVILLGRLFRAGTAAVRRVRHR